MLVNISIGYYIIYEVSSVLCIYGYCVIQICTCETSFSHLIDHQFTYYFIDYVHPGIVGVSREFQDNEREGVNCAHPRIGRSIPVGIPQYSDRGGGG